VARLEGRGDPPETVAKRMAAADDEMSHAGEFDYVVVNDDFDRTVAEVRAMLHAERRARRRLPGLTDFLRSLRG
jgi:guanylate kinase